MEFALLLSKSPQALEQTNAVLVSDSDKDSNNLYLCTYVFPLFFVPAYMLPFKPQSKNLLLLKWFY